ncbi:MAG TPA: lipoprotein-releasing system ATP-binding protein LolD [Bacteroidales bacterium]|nr:lipoprotein-releasing system ATP-binding protein LolD [Bacteroidales bacterium]
MIKAIDIHKSFGGLEVLKGIDMKIKKGEIVTIVGSSGAGKTTLLQIIGTLLQAEKGKVFYDNVEVSQFREREMAHFRNTKIGFVFQFHHLLPEFTALENICIPAFIAKKPKEIAEQKALELLSFLNLADRAEHKPNELSGGEQQRVAVARALINDPDVILADEPSGNLDTFHKNELHQLFFDLRDKFNQTFVVVTHDKELAAMSARMLTMKDGRILS